MESLIAIATLAIIGYMVGSVKVINQGYEGIVERLGRYQRTLRPGLNFVVPLLDTVLVETTREQLLDIEPQSAITKDNVTIIVNAVMYWKIVSVEQAYYEVENLEEALSNMVLTTLRSEIGQMDLRETVSSRTEINKAILRELKQATESWGVEVTRVEVQEITLSEELRRALEAERTAESKRRAALSEAEATVESIRRISRALDEKNAGDVLRYLVAQDYVEANQKLGASSNAKIIFMDPKALNEAIDNLMATDDNYGGGSESASGPDSLP